MDQNNLSNAERIVVASMTNTLPSVPKPKFVMSEAHKEKLRVAREEYQRKLKAGEIAPPVRGPKPTPVTPQVAVAPVSGVRMFSNTRVRYEFIAQNNFDGDPVGAIYVTDVRGHGESKGYYLIENLAGEFLTLDGKWIMVVNQEKYSGKINHPFDLPLMGSVRAALSAIGIEFSLECLI